jgi:hypothetical protein
LGQAVLGIVFAKGRIVLSVVAFVAAVVDFKVGQAALL